MFEPVKASCKNTRRYCLLWAPTRWSFWFFFSHEKKKRENFAYFLSVQKVKTIFWKKITLRYLSTQGSNRKVRAGIEPANMSFADSRLTTWPPHRNIKSVRPNYYSKKI